MGRKGAHKTNKRVTIECKRLIFSNSLIECKRLIFSNSQMDAASQPQPSKN